MTNEEKLSKMCGIVQEIDQVEEAKAVANKYYNDELKKLWTQLKSAASEDTRQAEMEFGAAAGTTSEGPVVDVASESDKGRMKEGAHFEIPGSNRKSFPLVRLQKHRTKCGGIRKNLEADIDETVLYEALGSAASGLSTVSDSKTDTGNYPAWHRSRTD